MNTHDEGKCSRIQLKLVKVKSQPCELLNWPAVSLALAIRPTGMAGLFHD
jgi:hypothetical protein